MKSFYCTLLFLSITLLSLAQSKEELALKDQFWNSNDPKLKIVEVPEKWKDESAVFLYREESYQYTNNGKQMFSPSYTHQRVKLLDRAAVEYFSDFSYTEDNQVAFMFRRYYQQKTTIGIKIIKPDGSEIFIDVDEEKVKQDNVYKVAIPGLEVGDIIDSFVYEYVLLRSFTGTHYYEPVEKLLSSRYPTLHRKISVEVEKDYFLNMESYNEAPKIREEETERRRTKKYILEADNLEKIDLPRWYYPLVELPAVKFQITFALRAKNERHAKVFLANNDTERKYNVSHEEILEYYGNRFSTANRYDLRAVIRHLRDKKITDKKAQLEEALYLMRHRNYNSFIELYIARENKIITYPSTCNPTDVFIDESSFVQYMTGLAKELDIDYDLIIATADYNGSIDDLLLRSNVSFGIRFNFDKPLYMFNLGSHVQADFFPFNLEGTKVYKISVRKNRKLEEVTVDYLPVTTASENINFEKVSVSIENDFSLLKIKRDLKFSGQFKPMELNRRLFFGDFLDQEFQHFDNAHFYNCNENRQTRGNKSIQDKMEALMLTFRKNKEESLKELINNSFDVNASDYNYKVVNTARFSSEPLHINDSFQIKDQLVRKAGNDYIVEVGKLIGGQVQITEDEKERELNIYINYAKTFKYEVEIQIPDGYQVVGLEKLQKNVSNATGSFISTASIENNILKYTTEKIYAKRKYEKQEWAQMIYWLQAAYDFTQERVLFKKI